MIDPDLINPIAKEGFKLLAQSGVFQAQIKRDQERVLSGDADEEPEDIALAVKKLRRRVVIWESLHELGSSFVKESEQ
jgi:hypothetical protein